MTQRLCDMGNSNTLLIYIELIKETRTAEMALFSLLLILLALNSALSARIAGVCTLGGSQYINMRHALEELACRGHEVVCNIALSVLNDNFSPAIVVSQSTEQVTLARVCS